MRAWHEWPATVLAGLLAVVWPQPVAAGGPSPVADTVVLLHGLGRSSRSMTKMAAALRAHGYNTVLVDYPSLQEPIQAHARQLADVVTRCCSEAPTPRVHFVGHSLGGIVIRKYLADHRPQHLGRVVMLASPNGGSEIADIAIRSGFLGSIVGPSALALGTGDDGIVSELGAAGDVEIGVITGNRSWNPLFSWLIPGPDDGQVSIESARLDGMRDFLVVPHTHTFLMNSDDVIAQTVAFLQTGSFDHGGERTVMPGSPSQPIAASAAGR